MVVGLSRKWPDWVLSWEVIHRSNYVLADQNRRFAFLSLRDLLYGQQRTCINDAVKLVGCRITFIDNMLKELLVPAAPEVAMKSVACGVARGKDKGGRGCDEWKERTPWTRRMASRPTLPTYRRTCLLPRMSRKISEAWGSGESCKPQFSQ